MQNPKTKDVHFVEVKFRANGEFRYKDLPSNYPYENAFIVLVSKKHIKCLTVTELKEGKEITSSSQNYLGSQKEFDLDKDVIIEFCKFAVQFFEGVWKVNREEWKMKSGAFINQTSNIPEREYFSFSDQIM